MVLFNGMISRKTQNYYLKNQGRIQGFLEGGSGFQKVSKILSTFFRSTKLNF